MLTGESGSIEIAPELRRATEEFRLRVNETRRKTAHCSTLYELRLLRPPLSHLSFDRLPPVSRYACFEWLSLNANRGFEEMRAWQAQQDGRLYEVEVNMASAGGANRKHPSAPVPSSQVRWPSRWVSAQPRMSFPAAAVLKIKDDSLNCGQLASD